MKEVIGLVKHFVDEDGPNVSYQESTSKVAKILHDHWLSRNVYPITEMGILKRLKKQVEIYRKLARQNVKTRGPKWMNECKTFKESSEKLFDVFCTNDSHRKDLEKTHKIPMLKEDFEFLESTKGDRKMCCEKNVDSEYHDQQDANEEQYRLRVEQQNTTFDAVSSLSINIEGDLESDSIDLDRNNENDVDF